MKNKFKGILLRLGSGFLTILGFASCANLNLDPDGGDGSGNMWVEYGSPNATYRISGTVKSQTGASLKSIRVVTTFGGSTWARHDTTYTDESGVFSSQINTYPSEKAVMEFVDVDGADNGGEFAPTTQTITPVQIEKGSGAWFHGTYKVHADVKLNKK